MIFFFLSILFPQECRFRIIRGTIQHFVDMHGRYLTVLPGGRTRSEAAKGEAAKFRICFPVVEGVLEKKGTSGLHRWQVAAHQYSREKNSFARRRTLGNCALDVAFLRAHTVLLFLFALLFGVSIGALLCVQRSAHSTRLSAHAPRSLLLQTLCPVTRSPNPSSPLFLPACWLIDPCQAT